MCKHVVYTSIVNFQMNIVYRRKIKNRKKEDGGIWLIGARTQNIPYFSIVTTQQKTRQRRVRHLFMRIKTSRRVRCVLIMDKARINDG